MRWFSWWQSSELYEGENFMNKYLMLTTTDDSFDEIKEFELPEGLSPQGELRQVKMKHGSGSLAPQLVSLQSFWKQNLIAGIARPLWNDFTSTTDLGLCGSFVSCKCPYGPAELNFSQVIWLLVCHSTRSPIKTYPKK